MYHLTSSPQFTESRYKSNLSDPQLQTKPNVYMYINILNQTPATPKSKHQKML